ncbi:choline-responsive transcriptional repressor BetI [Mesorhizobium sp. B1-1-8]|uniref:choline-binding transcriptional repressor BetI n=1 Tax=Mesorhizobium sp. B1-1-8 TaxID=2589976 RepID=UPI001129E5AE|nr:transcriptional regulator BetI [Mesorhizobium sp. B1-1-8]UCI10444.1 transcriptional regulator BetI [Mesorhizobium sp. B1-1-8]
MSLTKISDIRRRELRHAAYEVLQKEGMAGATVEKVAQRAGASKGIVHHYFKTKQELFEHAMRHSNSLLRDEVIRLMRLARSPEERLWAIIEGNFATAFFTPGICHAWLALCAEVPREPQLARIQRVVHARMHSNLISALAAIVPVDERETVALGITTLIDGLWLRLGLRPGELAASEALAQLADYLIHRIPHIAWDKHLSRTGSRLQSG